MPKSAKKRKDKAADFAKAKLKLGKEKKLPSNVIDTSFKARSIALPTQSIIANKDENVPTTKRKLTIDDLLVHLKHYSPSVKKDALLGLIELLESHWILVSQNLSKLIYQLARIIGDEDAGVRKQLLAFFSWVLPKISKEDLTPHASTLLLFTASAQTHIFPEIRIDAVRLLTLFLEYIPEPLVEGWNKAGSSSKRILEGYLGNLNVGVQYGDSGGPVIATPTSGVILSPASRLTVLQSFGAFLKAALATEACNSSPEDFKSPLHAWFMSRSFSTQEAFLNFESTLTPLSPFSTKASCSARGARDWSKEGRDSHNYPITDFDMPWTIQEVEEVATSVGSLLERSSTEKSTLTFISHLARTLHPLLVSTILDCAPSVFSPEAKSSEIETSMMVAINQIVSLLYGTILRGAETTPDSSLSELEAILGYMTPYFPFTTSMSRDMKIVQSFQDLNLIYCELTSMLVLCSNPTSIKSGQSFKPSNRLMVQVSNVSDYIAKLLRGSTSQVSSSLPAGAYLALLPSIWAIINSSYPALSLHSADVLQALFDHANKTSSKSSTKRLTLEFVARLILLETEVQYQGLFRVGSHNQAPQQLENWLIHLPRTLWELGSSDSMATEVILRFLLRLLQRRSLLVKSPIISELALRFVPYFVYNHPIRGRLAGPYSKLPVSKPHLRKLCLDVVATLLDCGGRFGVEVSEACGGLFKTVDSAVADTVDKGYWTHVQMYTGISASH